MADINRLGTQDLGKVNIWNDSKTALISPISFPGKDAGNTEGIDTLGIIAYIDIGGRFTGTFAQIQNFIASIKAIADGNQTSSQQLFSPFVNSVNSSGSLRIGYLSVNTSLGTTLVDSTVNFTTSGIQIGDFVKNIVTGSRATVTTVGTTSLILDSDIFASANLEYGVTANINVKVLGFDPRWQPPAVNFCEYTLSLMQVT